MSDVTHNDIDCKGDTRRVGVFFNTAELEETVLCEDKIEELLLLKTEK